MNVLAFIPGLFNITVQVRIPLPVTVTTTLPECLLCHSPRVQLLEEISTATLSFLYRKYFDLEVPDKVDNLAHIGFYCCQECSLRFFSPAITGTTAFYQELQKRPWYYIFDKHEYELAAGFVKPNDKVLDVGCGTGKFAGFIPHAAFTGLELNPDCQKESSVLILNEPVQQHAQKHFEKYDVVTAFQVLEHVSAPHSFLQACIDALKPGGILVVSVPNDDSLYSKMHNCILNMPPHHITRWSQRSLQSIARRFDLTMLTVKEEPLAEVHAHLFRSAGISTSFRKAFGLKSFLLDNSMPAKLVQFASNVLAGIPLFSKNGKLAGHTITAIYRKAR